MYVHYRGSAHATAAGQSRADDKREMKEDKREMKEDKREMKEDKREMAREARGKREDKREAGEGARTSRTGARTSRTPRSSQAGHRQSQTVEEVTTQVCVTARLAFGRIRPVRRTTSVRTTQTMYGGRG